MQNNWQKEPILDIELQTMTGGLKLKGEKRWREYNQIVSFKEMEMSSYWKDAVFWYRQAALQYEPLAVKMLQCIMDFLYVRRRAQKGDAEAQYLLSVYYFYAYGIYEDTEAGARWFKKAARNGSQSALKSIEKYNRMVGSVHKPDDPDFAATPVLVPEVVRRSYMKGRHGKIKKARFALTQMEPIWEKYHNLDFDETQWLAIRGEAEMQYALAWLYDWGQGVKQDMKQAVNWFAEAAFNRYAPAQTELGILYQFGISATKMHLQLFDGKEKVTG